MTFIEDFLPFAQHLKDCDICKKKWVKAEKLIKEVTEHAKPSPTTFTEILTENLTKGEPP